MKTAQFRCIECGRPITREWHHSHDVCADCAAQHERMANSAPADRRGAHYARLRRDWLAALENVRSRKNA